METIINAMQGRSLNEADFQRDYRWLLMIPLSQPDTVSLLQIMLIEYIAGMAVKNQPVLSLKLSAVSVPGGHMQKASGLLWHTYIMA